MIRNYQIIEKIGKGTFGIVYKVKKFNEPLIYVIKQISLEGLTDFQINQVYSEVKILSLIKSKYVVKYYESFLEENNLNIVMEYCDNGDLCNYLKEQQMKNKPLKEDLIWKIFIKITLGLTTIHKMKILHRDLKTLNIFLKKNMEIKIGDLGVAKELNQASFANTIIGTPFYLSPEMCEDKPYNQKSDIWALGVILYELCTFRHPFNASNHAALILKIMTANPDPILACYSSNLQKIVNWLLEKQIEKRPYCWDILNMKIVGEKAKMLGLYHEIINVLNENNNINTYFINVNNNKINQTENFIPMDSEDILLQSKLAPLDHTNTMIQVKKIKNDENKNKNGNYIFGDKMKNTNQNEYINNFNNLNQIPPYNYNYYAKNEPNIINNSNINNYYLQNGNYIMNNNDYNNLYNNNYNQNNNIIFNNILINNNTINTNDPNLINNQNYKQNFVRVTKVYHQPDIKNSFGHFVEDRNISDINDSLNISVQAPQIDMDRIDDKMPFPINASINEKDYVDEYNYPANAEISMDNINDKKFPKDNTRKHDNKIDLKNIKNENQQLNSEKKLIKENESGEKEDYLNHPDKSMIKSNSFVGKEISPIKLITNTQESIDIMENIKNLNLDDNSKKEKSNKFNEDIKKVKVPKKVDKGYKYQKKKLNLDNKVYKNKEKEKGIIKPKKNIDINEDIDEKKLNLTSENLSSSDNFNLNVVHQDTIPVSKYLKSNNLKNSSLFSDENSDSGFNLLKSSENDINPIENDKLKLQKIPEFDMEENVDDKNNSFDNDADLNKLEEKFKNIQNEIFQLVGEKDYSYMINLYNQAKNKENFFKELEIFFEKSNYTQNQKEKILDLYFSLISIQDKIQQKKNGY